MAASRTVRNCAAGRSSAKSSSSVPVSQAWAPRARSSAKSATRRSRSGGAGTAPSSLSRGGGDGEAVRRHALCEGTEPGLVVRPLAQQLAALAQGLVIGADPCRVLGIETVDEAVEKAPAWRRRLEKETIHLRRQPHQI